MRTLNGRQSVIREEDLSFFYLGVKVLYASRCFLRLSWYLKAGLLPFCPVEAGQSAGLFLYVWIK